MIKILDGFPRIVFLLETMISMFMSFVDNLTSPLMIGESKKKSSNWSEDYILKISEETHMGML